MSKAPPPEPPAPDYVITITRYVSNPAYRAPMMGYGYRQGQDEPEFLERAVTTATLDEAQWRAVQRTIVDVMGNAHD